MSLHIYMQLSKLLHLLKINKTKKYINYNTNVVPGWIIPGWFNSRKLYDLVINNCADNSNIVELGSYFGESTVYMSKLIKNSKKSIKFYAIDLWEWRIWIDIDNICYFGYHRDLKKIEHNFIMGLFNKNMFKIINHYLKKNDVANYVKLIKHDSIFSAYLFDNTSLDFVYLDTQHTYERVYNEIKAWLPKLKNGGIIGGDDLDRDDNNDGGVSRAVRELSKNNFITDDVTWYFYK